MNRKIYYLVIVIFVSLCITLSISARKKKPETIKVNEYFFINTDKGVHAKKKPVRRASITGTLVYLQKVMATKRTKEKILYGDPRDKSAKEKDYWYYLSFKTYQKKRMERKKGWVYAKFLNKITDIKKHLKLNYKVNTTSEKAHQCCVKLCTVNLPEWCKKGRGGDESYMTVCVCPRKCKNGLQLLKHGWTPSMQEWLNNDYLQTQLIKGKSFYKFRPTPYPEKCAKK